VSRQRLIEVADVDVDVDVNLNVNPTDARRRQGPRWRPSPRSGQRECVSGPALLAIVLASAPAFADVPLAPPDMSDQAIGGGLGVALGGRVTPGGLRVDGHYLYQLSSQDWFDGTVALTFGGGSPECFFDRTDTYVCDHGLAQGDGFEVIASVRHFLGGRDTYWPFVHGGIGLGYVRFGADDVGGLAIPLHAGGGLRVSITPDLAIVGQAELDLGIGVLGHGVGLEPQFGADLTVGVEFRL
jgi:hypothetical protein